MLRRAVLFPKSSTAAFRRPEGPPDATAVWPRSAPLTYSLCLREACLRRGVSLADSLVRVEIRASDWSGLRALVEASDDMKYRRQTMELLDTTPAEKRMDALWGLKWGVPYTYVQRYLLPRLRSASIVVSGGGAALGDDAGEAIAAAVRKIAAATMPGRFRCWSLGPGTRVRRCRLP